MLIIQVKLKKIILSYNQKLWFGHRPDNEINYLYIHKYANNLDFIIEKLKTYTKKGYQGYSNLSDKWLNKNNISSEEKKIIIQKIFRDTQVAFIYGSAGSGKTTLINYMSQIFNDKSKIFLSHTNSSVNNLKKRINSLNSKFMTITKYINTKGLECDILFVDEYGVVNDSDMKKSSWK
ncbi:AAA family ATPase [Mycoplasma capricolum subsp. capripneumoniae]|nr:AAA family ATPase [Mycoplasma capricolum subsp. capripneumoniae]QIN46649.1 AAA family ATPase [Mycoplasma capricolum subsp. capripneumoniae]QIN47341.1 AAA family ATPase [Mycoplasma capricolum subsp. capripneumoniae]QIN48712.1 AAA family ATPase [Mycoplasma capricolum subsp. capripneumoniae]QIN49400.1 AAA family ATPase [Mycoplasma capricolum subsp. capripneumoniae]